MPHRRKARFPEGVSGKELFKNYLFLQGVINAVTEPIVVIGTDMRVKMYNKEAGILSSLNKNPDLHDVSCHRLLFGRDLSCDQAGQQCPFFEVLESGQPVSVEHMVKDEHGEVCYLEILASPLNDEDGVQCGVIETVRDITSRKKIELALKKAHEEMEIRIRERTADLQASCRVLRMEVEERQRAEEQLRATNEQNDLMCRILPSALFTVDTARRITSWNDKAEEITGFSRHEVVGKKCDVFSLQSCYGICGVYADDVKKPIVGKECEIRTKNGELRIISKNADLLRDFNGGVIGAVEIFEDITHSKQVERELRTERDKFMGMLSALGQGMHIVNRDFGIEYQNAVLRDHFGDKLGQKCYEVYKQRDTPCEICRMHEALIFMEIQRTELLMADGRYYEQSYAPFKDIDGEGKVVILLRDITEEKVHQAETMRAGQLASVGELAAGVAHEVNNPINGIINYAQILLDETPDESTREVLQRIISEGERIAGIVGNLLSFARQRGEEREVVQVETVLEDSLALLKHQLQKDGIIISQEIEKNLPPVRVNPQQLQQVFLNLLSNARYALDERYVGRDPGKKLDICCKVLNLRGGDFVRTTFTDRGTGIPPEIIGKIFDPFFSSKKPGEGTGLGLSISHGIIKDFNGSLLVESRVNEFTAMKVDLPVTDPLRGHEKEGNSV